MIIEVVPLFRSSIVAKLAVLEIFNTLVVVKTTSSSW